MRQSFTLLFLAIVLLSFSACGGKIESLTFESPDGDRSIDISGEKSGLAGPIVVKVVLHIPKGDETFTFEHQGSNLNKENVTADWRNNNHCIVTFKHDDNTKWELECFLFDDKVEAIRNFQLDGKGIF